MQGTAMAQRNDGERREDDERPSKDVGGSQGETSKGQDQNDDGQDDRQPSKAQSILKKPAVLIGGGLILLVLIVGGLLFWLHARHFVSTDDAFIDVRIARISPQVPGRIQQVMVTDNQLVEPGQVLAQIDPADLKAKLDQALAQQATAEGQLAQAEAGVTAAGAGLQEQQAAVRAADAQAVKAHRDYDRYIGLQKVNAAAVAGEQVDAARAQMLAADAQKAQAVSETGGGGAQIRSAQAQVDAARAQVQTARAQVEAARLNLSYATLRAPVRGTIAQRNVAVGGYVAPGQELMAVVPQSLWITANFKETQLTRMRPGQPVTVKVDAFPDVDFQGHVDSIQRGAGQAFAILPPQNATGNYVKVVQRVPVKILLDHVDPNYPLGPGMSVTPKVRVR